MPRRQQIVGGTTTKQISHNLLMCRLQYDQPTSTSRGDITPNTEDAKFGRVQHNLKLLARLQRLKKAPVHVAELTGTP